MSNYFTEMCCCLRLLSRSMETLWVQREEVEEDFDAEWDDLNMGYQH